MSNPQSSFEDIPHDDSAASTPAATPTLSSAPYGGGRLAANRGQSARWTAAETPTHHHQGTSYFPTVHSRPVSPMARRQGYLTRAISSSSVRHARSTRDRSTSLTSARTGGRRRRDREEEGLLSEEEEGEDVVIDEREDLGEGTSGEHGEEETQSERERDPVTVKARQSLINVEHPFGLPIWKPALYKKSRSVTRYADQELHSVPSAQAERHLRPGNILWAIAFGWWLALAAFFLSAVLYLIPYGGRQYASLVFGLGWYIAWPFGKYVEGEGELGTSQPSTDEETGEGNHHTSEPANGETTPATDSTHSTVTPRHMQQHSASVSWDSNLAIPSERTNLLNQPAPTIPSKSYGATPSRIGLARTRGSPTWLGKTCYFIGLSLLVAPLMFLVCTICWALVFTVPMAKLNWALIKYLYEHPADIRFCAAPVVAVPAPEAPRGAQEGHDPAVGAPVSFKHARLSAGQAAPSGSPTSTVLLCVYRASGWKYYKYTVGGVNIMFVNLLPIVFLVILDGFILLPFVENKERAGEHVPALFVYLTSRPLIFLLSLASVIPLSYFIGMAVASISAQSSIGMGAVINATFGSIIEIVLYSIALTQQRGHLVEGSIVGSLMAGVLLMPGMSMVSGALRRKEMKFNAKSAGVTSMLLIMAFIGTLTPTLFYQTYGSFQLVCEGCPDNVMFRQSPARKSVLEQKRPPWACQHCYYEHPDPVEDPFYQSTVKTLMYFCACVLLLSYLIGLWFSLRTHASQIWQNPQQLLHPTEMPIQPHSNRLSIYQRLIPGTIGRQPPSLHRKPSIGQSINSEFPSGSQTPVPRQAEPEASSSSEAGQHGYSGQSAQNTLNNTTAVPRRISYVNPPMVHPQGGLTPLLESVDHAIQDTAAMPGLRLPGHFTSDDFTRAVAVAAVSALRHQQQNQTHSLAKVRISAGEESAGEHGGHDAPSWSRATSASVLLVCTALYAAIAEILVDVVDVVLEGSGIDEKFLGVTLFALVPNTTEFMNAISFAMNGNIALSMEIGSAYALQVCLLQIPAMVAFSAWYAPDRMGSVSDTFTLIFPRWDTIVIILAVFLMTYTYIEAKSNYHRGSILILSYLVLCSGFYFAPQRTEDSTLVGETLATLPFLQSIQAFFSVH